MTKSKKKQSLTTEWEALSKSMAEANALVEKGNLLHTEGSMLFSHANQLYTKSHLAGDYMRRADGAYVFSVGSYLTALGVRLRARAKHLWAIAVHDKFGDTTVEWSGDSVCRLGCGEVYGTPEKSPRG